MNTQTPRVFVTATHQNDGKDDDRAGAVCSLQKRRGRTGYIKPVSQRFVEVDGKQIDEDAMLTEDSFGMQMPLENMSSIAVEPDSRIAPEG